MLFNKGITRLTRCDVWNNCRGILLESTYQEILTAYEALLRLRMRRQILAIQEGRLPTNPIDLAEIGHIEEALLWECVKESDTLQMRIRRDFLGGEYCQVRNEKTSLLL